MAEAEEMSSEAPPSRRRRLSVSVVAARDALHDSAVANSPKKGSQETASGAVAQSGVGAGTGERREGGVGAGASTEASPELGNEPPGKETQEEGKGGQSQKPGKAKMKTPEEVRLELMKSKQNMAKKVKWGSVNFRTYKVGIGSGVPANGGPSVGLAGKHVSEERIPLDVYESTKSKNEKYHKDGIVSAMERTWWLKKVHRKQSIDQEKVLVSLSSSETIRPVLLGTTQRNSAALHHTACCATPHCMTLDGLHCTVPCARPH